ncbi:hypothetical protein P879_02831 [Paragonimus westermani]|uniref:Fibronectin type-III domain-containing protein n=1 Tax=Paragonimus westermani TaxID=34504 RepID=A0A8T0DDW5_9TREM|nr:hypothetical protein P879_02831 [Paragonimus westermani]
MRWIKISPNVLQRNVFSNYFRRLVLINLGDLPSLEKQKLCLSFLQAHNLTQHGQFATHHRMWSEPQLTVNITAPASSVMIEGLPPDNFYRILLFAVSGEMRGFPASMPSSPRVPSLPPLTVPNEIRCTTRGNQEIKVDWKPPDGVDCTGELINYVISINSSRLIEPLLIKVDRDVNSYVVKDLLPGTYYTIQMSASTRGGMGVFSEPLHFRTGGEVPRVDLDDTEDLEDLPELTEPHSQFYEGETVQSRWITTNPSTFSATQLHMVPVKIHNLRATPGETSIHLKWSVALRRVNPEYEQELFPKPNGDIHSSHVASRLPLPVPLSTGPNSDDQTGYLPPGTKYIIRWGDMHPGPAEDTVLGDQTEYLIQNLRPGTIYYIRVIAVTRLGDGPAAYTVTMTKNVKIGTPKPLSKGLIIPVNLVVRAVGASWARVGWELPEMPTSYRSPSLVFQIKYYPIHLDQARTDVTLRPPSQGSTGTGMVTIVNVTVPWTAQLSKQSKLFKAMLRGLQAATQYEFGVCMMQDQLEDRSRHNRPTDSRKPPELCWSMVQGFETVGQNPADPPRNIRVTFPKGITGKQNFRVAESSTASQNTDTSTQASPDVLTVRLTWDPPRQPYGTIIAYLIYFTVDKYKLLNEWLERTALGEVRQTDLSEMRPSEIYFLRMAARNRHGASPFSPVIVFRTPDADGVGGGIVRLSKVYYDAREIEETLDQMDPDFRFESNSETPDRASHTSEQQNATTREQIQWIIVGCVLGGTVVIVLVAVSVLFHRCHYTGHSLGIVKRSGSKQPYVAAYPNYYPGDTNCLSPEFNTKKPNLTLTDTCLGSCSLNGSAVGGSATGVFGTCVTSDSSGGPRGVPDCSGHPAIGSQQCTCSDWSSTGRLLPGGNVHSCGVMEAKCSCRVTSDAVHATSGWVQSSDPGGCYADDRHSSQHDSENSAVVLCGNELQRIDTALGRRLSERVPCDVPECCNYATQKTVGIGGCTNIWSRSTDDAPNHQMTMSFLASNLHHPVPQFNQAHLYRDQCDATPPQHSRYVRPVNGRQPVYIAEVGERSVETPFQKLRNVPTTMIGFTGSGSLNEDEAIASSPASSSVERTSGVLHHSSVSPTHGPNRLRTYSHHQQYPNLYTPSKAEHNSPQRTFVCETQQAANKIGRNVSNPVNHLSPLNTPGQTARINVMSSDYASQQSSLSNPSSASSAAGHGFSPERRVSNTSTSIGTENRANDVGLSFALDRVPTPEPTPRPAPFSRLATGELNQRAQIRLNAQKLDKDDVNNDDDLKRSGKVKKEHGTRLTISPTLVKKSQLSVFANGQNTVRDLARQRKIFPHEGTPDTMDSISEKELLREYSAEELNQEMANLEGLMKDLNQITQNQFNS